MSGFKFRELNKVMQINGHKIPVKVTIEVSEDDLTPEGDFDFGNEEENQAYLKRFHSGDLFMGMILVRAIALDLEGIDCLGACHLHANNMFNSKPFNRDVNQTVKEYAMINNALTELKANIIDQADKLKPYASKTKEDL